VFGGRVILPVASFIISVTGVLAEDIRETNFQHIDHRVALTVPGGVDTGDAQEIQSEDGRLVLSSDRQISRDAPPALVTGPEKGVSVVVTSETPLCVIGMSVSISAPGSNQINVRFSFYEEDGTLIGVQNRWPAHGTTFQAYEMVAGRESPGFSAVEIASPSRAMQLIAYVTAMPCAAPMS